MDLVVILSGGSEIVAVSLAEEFLAAGYSLAVVSLGKRSLLQHSVDRDRYFEISWPPKEPEEAAGTLSGILERLAEELGAPVQIFPTEDSGLRLLLEYRELIEPWARFGYARSLGRLGGLDKSELFEALNDRGCSDIMAPTGIVHSVDEIEAMVELFNGDCIIKPALKPFSMQLPGMTGKVFESRGYQSLVSLEDRLKRSWMISDRWVVQQRLDTPAMGEAVVWAVRDATGALLTMMAVEVRKQPRIGGTGCWVRVVPLPEELRKYAGRVLDAIDFVGLCELPFLCDEKGGWRLLELNPRAWLQVGLAAAADMPLALQASRALSEKSLDKSLEARDGTSWVNVERYLISAASGDYGSRWNECVKAIQAIRRADLRAIHDTKLNAVKRLWVLRMVIRLLFNRTR